MTQLLTPHAPASPDLATILACLARIRRRLWAARLTERLTLAVGLSALLSLLTITSRLLLPRAPWGTAAAITADTLLLFSAALLWQNTPRLNQLAKGALTPSLIRSAALLTALLALASSTLLFLPFTDQIPVWSVAAIPAFLFIILAIFSVRLVDARAAAIFVDQQAGLEERVATALELLESPANSPLEEAFRAPVIESAVAACHQVKRAKVGYWRIPPQTYAFAALAALAAVGMSLLTPLPSLAKPAPKKYTLVVDSARKMADALKEIENKRLPNDTVTAEKIKPLQTVITALKEGKMSPLEAQIALDQAKAAMKEDQKQMEAADKVQDMLKAMEQTTDIAKAADPLKDAQMSQAAGNADAGARQQGAQSGLEKAAGAIADKMKNGSMSESDKSKLADGLKQAAGQAGGDSQLKQSLDQAADAAAKGDADATAKNLQSAAQRIAQQSTGRQLSQDAVRRAMSQIDNLSGAGTSSSEQSAMNNNTNQGGTNGGGNQGNQGNQGDQQGNSGGSQGKQGNQGNQGQNQGDKGGQGQQAGADGQGQGQGQGDGKGDGAGDNGSTNFKQAGAPGSKDQGNKVGKLGTFVRIYDPHDIKADGTTEKVAGQINPIGKAAGTIQVLGEGERNATQIDTYDSQLPGARQRAMDDLTQQRIPPQYEDMVKTFYSEDAAKPK